MSFEIPTLDTIDVPRLFDDLQLTESDMQHIAELDIPRFINVTSASSIKTATMADVLAITRPGELFEVIGNKVPSDVDEQPLGQIAIDGSLNRLNNGIQAQEQRLRAQVPPSAWVSIENGLFRRAPLNSRQITARSRGAQVLQFTELADLSVGFDPDADYEDRAVATLRIPGRPTIVQVSPASEAVMFPRSAVVAAYSAEGGFAQHTAGSQLAEMDLVKDKQNPHSELTADRPGGPLPRQDQMARVIIRSLVRLTKM